MSTGPPERPKPLLAPARWPERPIVDGQMKPASAGPRLRVEHVPEYNRRLLAGHGVVAVAGFPLGGPVPIVSGFRCSSMPSTTRHASQCSTIFAAAPTTPL
jgi:hypothetical protein